MSQVCPPASCVSSIVIFVISISSIIAWRILSSLSMKTEIYPVLVQSPAAQYFQEIFSTLKYVVIFHLQSAANVRI